MRITHLSLTSFRNYARLELSMPPGMIVLYGDNAQGKTSLLESVYYTSVGRFGEAARILDMEWIAFLPSIYGFAVCDCYYRIVETNELFKLEQARFLREHYIDPAYRWPI